MAFRIAEAFVEVSARFGKLNAGLKTARANATRGFRKMQDAAFRFEGGIDRVIKRMAVLGVAVAAAGVAFLKMAANVGEADNLFDVSMGNMADATREWSELVAKSLGLNAVTVRSNVGLLNLMFNSMGVGAVEAANMAKKLTILAEDMASLQNVNPTEAFNALRSGIVGEAEPLKRFGISMLEAGVKATAFRLGIAKVGSTLTEQEKIFARFAFIMESTTKTQGDLERTSGSLANQIRQLGTALVKLGEGIAKAFFGSGAEGGLGGLIGILNSLTDFVKTNAVAFKNWTVGFVKTVIVLGTVTLALKGVIVVLRAFAKAQAIAASVSSGKGGLKALAVKLAIMAAAAGLAASAVDKAFDSIGDASEAASKRISENMAAASAELKAFDEQVAATATSVSMPVDSVTTENRRGARVSDIRKEIEQEESIRKNLNETDFKDRANNEMKLAKLRETLAKLIPENIQRANELRLEHEKKISSLVIKTARKDFQLSLLSSRERFKSLQIALPKLLKNLASIKTLLPGGIVKSGPGTAAFAKFQTATSLGGIGADELNKINQRISDTNKEILAEQKKQTSLLGAIKNLSGDKGFQ